MNSSAVPVEPQDWRGGYTSDHPARRGGGMLPSPIGDQLEYQSSLSDREHRQFKEQPLREDPGSESGFQCPICLKRGFATAEALERHSATCTDFLQSS